MAQREGERCSKTCRYLKRGRERGRAREKVMDRDRQISTNRNKEQQRNRQTCRVIGTADRVRQRATEREPY